MPEEPAYISAAQFRSMLGIGASTLEKMRVENKLPASIKLGKSRRWPLQEVKAWLAQMQKTSNKQGRN